MIYVNCSGGADSVAVALLLWDRGEDFELIFADTGAELPEVYWLLPRVANKVGKPLRVVSGGGMFSQLVQHGWFLPSLQARWCTKSLKRLPLERHIAGEPFAVGLRADEPRRHGFFERNPTATGPLIDAGMGKKDVMDLCRKHDLLNPVYAWRTNVSCFCCPFQRKQDWLNMLTHHPALYAIAEEWERQQFIKQRFLNPLAHAGYTWSSHWALKDLREADQRQLRLLPEPDAEPCLICQYT